MTGLIVRLATFDERLLHALVLRRRPRLDSVMRGVTHLGDALVAIAVAGALMVGVVPGLEGAGMQAGFTLAVSHLLVQVVKRSINRRRPRFPVGMASLVEAPDRFSFPSGHAAASLSLALPLFLVLPAALGIPILLVGVAVGVSRCYLGVHYPGDVVAGWSLALGTLGVERLLLHLPPLF